MAKKNNMVPGIIIGKIILLVVTIFVIKEAYNYIGPCVRTMYTGEPKELAKQSFVKLDMYGAFVLYILASLLFKSTGVFVI